MRLWKGTQTEVCATGGGLRRADLKRKVCASQRWWDLELKCRQDAGATRATAVTGRGKINGKINDNIKGKMAA
jgi:hypothetical protein